MKVMGETSQPGPRVETTSASTSGRDALDFRTTPKEQQAERQQSPSASRPVSDGGSRAGDSRRRGSVVSPASRKWVTRAEVDRRARGRLRLLEGDGIVVLDDRRVPGSRDSIKLIAVSCAGVFVIDTKHYKGLVHTMRPGSIGNLGPHELHVGRRNCTSSVEQVARQMEVVRASLNSTPYGSQVPVHAMLCLTRAEWGFASAIQVGGVWVGWPNLMAGRVQSPGVMDSPAVREVSTMLADILPGS
jgi:hypothetical protein